MSNWKISYLLIIPLIGLFFNFLIPSGAHASSLGIVSGGNVELGLVPEIANTTVNQVRVNTDCRAGYTLSIKGGDDNNLYLDGLASNNTSGSFITPVDGTTSLNSLTNAYGYTLESSNTDNIFKPLTTTETILKTPDQTATTDTDIDDTTSIYYGGKVNNNLVEGTYSMSGNGIITYTAVAAPLCSTYTVNFNANGGSGQMPTQYITEGSPTALTANEFTKTDRRFDSWNTKPDGTGTTYANQEIVTDLATVGESVTLYAQWICGAKRLCYDGNGADSGISMATQNTSGNTADIHTLNYKRADHGFIGWNTKPDGTGTMYGLNGVITSDNLTTKGLVLYAIWQQSEGTLQNWNGCDNLAIGKTTALTDNRDNDTYAVAKLADGNCWMIENLRLDDTATLSTTNTNNPSLPLNNTDGTTSNHLSTPTTNKWCTNSGDANCINTSYLATLNTNNTVQQMGNNATNVYAYGNYYNYYSATAGNGGFSVSSGDVAGSICPAGWQLPFGGSDINKRGSFSYLDVALGGTGGSQEGNATAASRWIAYPNNFVFSGVSTSNQSATSRGTWGYYWSGTLRASGAAYALHLSSTSIRPNNYDNIKPYGRAVRCIIISDSYTINFDANNGTGETKTQTIKKNTSTNLIDNTFIDPDNRIFNGWNTAADGSGTKYTDKQSVKDITNPGGKITLYAQWLKCRAFYICYDPNGAEGSPTKNANQWADTRRITEITLLANNYQRPGYSFIGWNTKKDGSGTMYGPNEYYTVGDFSTEGERLYAIWKKSEGTIQNWQGCDTLNIGDVTVLTDSRDNDTYSVAKLADGKCWMTENLRLDHTVELTPENTNNPSLPLVNDYDLGTTSNHLSDPINKDVWCGNNPTYSTNCINQSRISTVNTADTTAEANSITRFIYAYGNAYNWYSATAGHGTYFKNTKDEIMSGSICPAGWQLPAGGTNLNKNDFYKLTVAVIGETRTDYYPSPEYSRALLKYPINLVLSSQRSAHQSNEQGVSTGAGSIMLWGSTSSTDAFRASVFYVNINDTNSSIDYSQYAFNYDGRPMRCILAEPYTITFDANGGSGQMSPQTIKRDVPTKLSENTFTPPINQTFKNWNTKPDGTGTSYSDKEVAINMLGNGNNAAILYAQWGCPSGAVCYDGNGADAGITMANQTSNLETLWAPNFKRAGYGFAAWNTKPDGTGTNYGPNETIDSDLYADGLTLYARWIKADGTLQNWGGCPKMTVGQVTALVDNRDGNVYAVAKLADGNCWLTENLRLAVNNNLTADNTDNPAITGLQISAGGWCFNEDIECVDTVRLDTQNTAGAVANMTSSNDNVYAYGNTYNWYTATAGTGTFSGGDATGSICPVGWKLPIGNSTNNGSFAYLSSKLPASDSNAFRKYPNNIVLSGNYQFRYYHNRGTSGFLPTSTNAGEVNMHTFEIAKNSLRLDTDLGWKYNGGPMRCTLGENNISSFAIKFDAGGGSGTMYNQNVLRDTVTNLPDNTFTSPVAGENFLFWSTNADGTGDRYTDGQSIINLAAAGESITLYARYGKDLSSITTMQEMNSTICKNTLVGTTKTLTDTRDNKTYTVRKAEDNHCWMTQNLRLGNTTEDLTLTAADSDVASNFTIPASAVTEGDNKPQWSGTNEIRVYSNGNNWIDTPTANTIATVKTSGTPPSQSQYIGNYYNWYTATAGTGVSGMQSGAETTVSICPKGWKLPSLSGEATDLMVALTGATSTTLANATTAEKNFALANSPNYLIWGGQYYPTYLNFGNVSLSPGPDSQGQNGIYMTSSASTNTLVFGGENDVFASYNFLYNGTASIQPYPESSFGGGQYKNYGSSVRCVAR